MTLHLNESEDGVVELDKTYYKLYDKLDSRVISRKSPVKKPFLEDQSQTQEKIEVKMPKFISRK